jgi:hypothetical protein
MGMWQVLEHYAPHVWEYGEDNYMAAARKLGEGCVSYVPLGWDESMVWRGGEGVEGVERGGGGADVIFYGRINEYRQGVLAKVR